MNRYPEHRFSATSAQQYKWLETLYPLLFDKVKEKIEQGSFGYIGSTWSESAVCFLVSWSTATDGLASPTITLRLQSRWTRTFLRESLSADNSCTASDTSSPASARLATPSSFPTRSATRLSCRRLVRLRRNLLIESFRADRSFLFLLRISSPRRLQALLYPEAQLEHVSRSRFPSFPDPASQRPIFS